MSRILSSSSSSSSFSSASSPLAPAVVALALLALAVGAGAAEYRVPLADPAKPARLEVGLVQGCVKIAGWDGNEVVVTAVGEEARGRVEKVEGMYRLRNTAMSIEVEQQDNVVEIDTDSWQRRVDLEVRVPYRTSVVASCVNGGALEVADVQGDHELSNVNGAIVATGMRGSVVAETTNGGLKVELLEVAADKPMSFACLNGGVEVTLPAGTSADLKIEPGQGDVYTDFPVELIETEPRVDREGDGRSYRLSVEREMRARIGGGGPLYSFQAFNGGIVLRRGE